MPGVAFHTDLKAKPGREEALAEFLAEQRAVVAVEPGNLMWIVLHFYDGRFAIVDAFDVNETRQSHLNGTVMQALKARAGELLETPPVTKLADVIADYTRS
jgi:quinol monooxygenase YgiN